MESRVYCQFITRTITVQYFYLCPYVCVCVSGEVWCVYGVFQSFLLFDVFPSHLLLHFQQHSFCWIQLLVGCLFQHARTEHIQYIDQCVSGDMHERNM